MNIQVIVAYATPDEQIEIPVELPAHCNVSLAIKKSGILKRYPEIAFPDIEVGVWGRRCPLDGPIVNEDRVEIYRPLTCDPMQARRKRAK